ARSRPSRPVRRCDACRRVCRRSGPRHVAMVTLRIGRRAALRARHHLRYASVDAVSRPVDETQRECRRSNDPIDRSGKMQEVATGTVPDPRRWWALALLCGAFFMVILDAAIVTVALPSIEVELGFSAQGLQWVVSAYALTFAGLLLLGGRAADLLGRRRVF